MFKKELSNEDIAKLKETIRIKLREKKIEEENTTASADGYNTPFAFGKDTKGDIKRKVKSSGEGFEFAKSIDENRWLELKRDETRTPSQTGSQSSIWHFARTLLTQPWFGASASGQPVLLHSASFVLRESFGTGFQQMQTSCSRNKYWLRVETNKRPCRKTAKKSNPPP
jgi:hypothetical protein